MDRFRNDMVLSARTLCVTRRVLLTQVTQPQIRPRMLNFEAIELELLTQVIIEDSNWLDSFHSSAPPCFDGVAKTSSDSECKRTNDGNHSISCSDDQQMLRRALSAPVSRPDRFPESQALQVSGLKSRLTAPATSNCITAKNIGLLKRAASSALSVKAGGVKHSVDFKSARSAQSKSPRRQGLIPIEMLVD